MALRRARSGNLPDHRDYRHVSLSVSVHQGRHLYVTEAHVDDLADQIARGRFGSVSLAGRESP